MYHLPDNSIKISVRIFLIQTLRPAKAQTLRTFFTFTPPYPNFVSGGVDFEAAKEYGVRVIWALSLPGKIAPVTSGAIIKNTIMNIIKELGV